MIIGGLSCKQPVHSPNSGTGFNSKSAQTKKKQRRSCNSSTHEIKPFSRTTQPNAALKNLTKSDKHVISGISAYSSFRARDNSSSDQFVLSNKTKTDENYLTTGRAAQRYVNVEDDELV